LWRNVFIFSFCEKVLDTSIWLMYSVFNIKQPLAGFRLSLAELESLKAMCDSIDRPGLKWGILAHIAQFNKEVGKCMLVKPIFKN